ncbi:Modification methylase DpnIIA [subsurface metagenome]
MNQKPHHQEKIKARPFVKWVGGKKQLLPKFERLYSPKYNNYFEPFIGGGAVFLYLTPPKAYLNDVNKALIWAYKNIKKNPTGIINLLKALQKDYYKKSGRERENFYYSVREEYNNLSDASLKKSARLIFLNKTCYNGMYRENSEGKFNVPFGRYKRPRILDEENLLALSATLKNTTLTSMDFEKAVEKAKRGDFVYFDPPYYPLSKTASFTSYSENGFLEKEQIRLKKTFANLDRKGVFVMLSNSYTNFIRNLYKDYKQIVVTANRAINCKAEGRGKIRELVILNYQV